jgi:predicted phosphodiesterase
MADFATVADGGVTFYLTHGHHASPDHLPPLEEGSIFLSGHTHVKMDEVRNGIRCLNPGSVSIPKDGSNSCMVWDNGTLKTVLLGG